MRKKCAWISVHLAPTHSAPQRVEASVGFQLSAAQIITTRMSCPILQYSCVHRHNRKVLDSQQYPIAARLLREHAPDVEKPHIPFIMFCCGILRRAKPSLSSAGRSRQSLLTRPRSLSAFFSLFSPFHLVF